MSLIGSKVKAFGDENKGVWAGETTKPKVFKITNIWGNITICLEGYDAKKDGLIYTDPCFKRELNALLTKFGASLEVSYSESGMQGNDSVNMDISTNL